MIRSYSRPAANAQLDPSPFGLHEMDCSWVRNIRTKLLDAGGNRGV